MAMFNSYVSLPEGIPFHITIDGSWMILLCPKKRPSSLSSLIRHTFDTADLHLLLLLFPDVFVHQAPLPGPKQLGQLGDCLARYARSSYTQNCPLWPAVLQIIHFN